MAHRAKIMGIVAVQVSSPYDNCSYVYNRFYNSSKLKNWMCVLLTPVCTFCKSGHKSLNWLLLQLLGSPSSMLLQKHSEFYIVTLGYILSDYVFLNDFTVCLRRCTTLDSNNNLRNSVHFYIRIYDFITVEITLIGNAYLLWYSLLYTSKAWLSVCNCNWLITKIWLAIYLTKVCCK